MGVGTFLWFRVAFLRFELRFLKEFVFWGFRVYRDRFRDVIFGRIVLGILVLVFRVGFW